MLHILLLVFFVGAAQAHDTSQYDDAVKRVAALSLNQGQALKTLQDHIYFHRDSFTPEEKQQLIDRLTQARENMCSNTRAGMFSGWSWLIALGFAIKAAIHATNAQNYLVKEWRDMEIDACVDSITYCSVSFVAALIMQAVYVQRVDDLFANQRAFEKQIDYMIQLLQ